MTLSNIPYEVMVVAKIRTYSVLVQARILLFFELIFPPVDSFFTQKALLTSKHNSLVLFIEQYLHPWMSYCGINYFMRIIRIRIGIRTIRNFATRLFRTFPGSLTKINGPTSIGIISRPEIILHKYWTPRFSRDISYRSIIYPTRCQFCFRGNSNINILPTLIIVTWVRSNHMWSIANEIKKNFCC